MKTNHWEIEGSLSTTSRRRILDFAAWARESTLGYCVQLAITGGVGFALVYTAYWLLRCGVSGWVQLFEFVTGFMGGLGL